MNKTSIIKEFSWDMAHMLSGHQGLCKNLHGHTYRMQVQVTSNNSGSTENAGLSDGMLMDFADLKGIVQKRIINNLDHAFMYWSNSNDPVEHQIAAILEKSDRKVVRVSFRPTAEEMAHSIYCELKEELKKINIVIEKIRIWETPTSYAEVSAEV